MVKRVIPTHLIGLKTCKKPNIVKKHYTVIQSSFVLFSRTKMECNYLICQENEARNKVLKKAETKTKWIIVAFYSALLNNFESEADVLEVRDMDPEES